jgi:hypothetical protein
VTIPSHAPAVRRLVRALALTPAAVLLVAATPAFADPPDQWQTADSVPGLHAFLILVAIPLGLFAAITFLALVPSMVRGHREQSEQSWVSDPEWFGGPGGGAAGLESHPAGSTTGASDTPSDRGGASGRW